MSVRFAVVSEILTTRNFPNSKRTEKFFDKLNRQKSKAVRPKGTHLNILGFKNLISNSLFIFKNA